MFSHGRGLHPFDTTNRDCCFRVIFPKRAPKWSEIGICAPQAPIFFLQSAFYTQNDTRPSPGAAWVLWVVWSCLLCAFVKCAGATHTRHTRHQMPLGFMSHPYQPQSLARSFKSSKHHQPTLLRCTARPGRTEFVEKRQMPPTATAAEST